MPQPPMWDRHVPGGPPSLPPREHDRRPIVLPVEPPRMPEGPGLLGEEQPGPNPGWRG